MPLKEFQDELQKINKNLYAETEHELQNPSSRCEAECSQLQRHDGRMIGTPHMEGNCNYPVIHNTPNSETPMWLCNITNICFKLDYDPTVKELTSPFIYRRNKIQNYRMKCTACFDDSLSPTASSKY